MYETAPSSNAITQRKYFHTVPVSSLSPLFHLFFTGPRKSGRKTYKFVVLKEYHNME